MDVWGALKTKGDKGGEEGQVSGPIMPLMLPAVQKKP